MNPILLLAGFAASLCAASEVESLLKSTSDYVPRRTNRCDADAACTQYVLPPKATTAQCKSALCSILYQPQTVASKWIEAKGRDVLNPIYQWFVDGPALTAQQYALNNGLQVEVTDASGFIVASVSATGTIQALADPAAGNTYYDVVRSMSTNIPTTNRQYSQGYEWYSVNVFNWDGQMYIVSVGAPLSSLPVL